MSGKILFVDDSPVIKKVVKKSIESIGYTLIDASNGKEGLSVLEKEFKQVKLVLSDWNMPIMNGFDFLKSIKKHKSFKNIPVIMITTESEKSNINKAIQAGASDYLLKPFNNNELIEKIKKCLDESKVKV